MIKLKNKDFKTDIIYILNNLKKNMNIMKRETKDKRMNNTEFQKIKIMQYLKWKLHWRGLTQIKCCTIKDLEIETIQN